MSFRHLIPFASPHLSFTLHCMAFFLYFFFPLVALPLPFAFSRFASFSLFPSHIQSVCEYCERESDCKEGEICALGNWRECVGEEIPLSLLLLPLSIVSSSSFPLFLPLHPPAFASGICLSCSPLLLFLPPHRESDLPLLVFRL